MKHHWNHIYKSLILSQSKHNKIPNNYINKNNKPNIIFHSFISSFALLFTV